jgi:nucleolar protein 56
MTATMRTIRTAWHGTYLFDGAQLVREARPPAEVEALAERARLRREGRTTPEENAVLAERGAETWRTADRRLVRPGVTYDPAATAPDGPEPAVSLLRPAILLDADRALRASWDPSVHVEEAVRSARDLDRAANLVGERLASWAARDAPDVDPTDPDRAARTVLEGAGSSNLGPADPTLAEARRHLARLYREIQSTRKALDTAVGATVPDRTPNLNSLLGADLTARLLAQARGLERLARLPASTVQVLGAERAFFEHLRGRAPPPRHGVLFLHPAIQSAPRVQRGRLARTLAGKVSIAARLDRAGSPLDPALAAAFEKRRAELKARRATPGREGPDRRSRPPLDGAAGDG